MSCCDYTTEINTTFVQPPEEPIEKLIKNLKKKAIEFEEEKHISEQFEWDKDLFYCWVTPINYEKNDDNQPEQDDHSQSQHHNKNEKKSVEDEEGFIFNFYLWIYYDDSYFRYQFTYGWDQLNNVYNKKKHTLCFVDKPWPKWFIEHTKTQLNQMSQSNQVNESDKREKILNEISKMEQLQKYMVFDASDIGEDPGYKSNWPWKREKKKANDNNAWSAAKVLCKIVNCPSLVLTAGFSNHFSMIKYQMLSVLQILAHNSLQHYRYIGYNVINKNDKHFVYEKKRDDNFWSLEGEHQNLFENEQISCFEYHHVYIMKNDGSFHWALKFVGFDTLLTIEYFNNSFVRIQLLDNNAVGHRIFWYGRSARYSQCRFTKRWNVMEKQILNPRVTAGQIGHWIDQWMKEYKEYHPLTNSCQHLVRDIMSAIDCNAGVMLIEKMQRIKISRTIWPSNVKRQEENRTKQISKILKLYGLLQQCQLMNLFDQLRQFDINQLKRLDEILQVHTEIKIEEKDIQAYNKFKYLLSDPRKPQ